MLIHKSFLLALYDYMIQKGRTEDFVRGGEIFFSWVESCDQEWKKKILGKK